VHAPTVSEGIEQVLNHLGSGAELPWEVWEKCFQIMQQCIDTLLRAQGAVVPLDLKDEKTNAVVSHLIDGLVCIRAKDRTGAVIALAAALVKTGAPELLVSKKQRRRDV